MAVVKSDDYIVFKPFCDVLGDFFCFDAGYPVVAKDANMDDLVAYTFELLYDPWEFETPGKAKQLLVFRTDFIDDLLGFVCFVFNLACKIRSSAMKPCVVTDLVATLDFFFGKARVPL